ncbi:hypothetical protein [Demequina aurantiaca]|uniref:hypothetical protein n=1 Tax=Demequina aurantiaca TaxID=676200 RepID=UPI003D345D32
MAFSTRALRSASAVTVALTLAGWSVASAASSPAAVTLSLTSADAVVSGWEAGAEDWPVDYDKSIAGAGEEAGDGDEAGSDDELAAAVRLHLAEAFTDDDLVVPVPGGSDGISALATVAVAGDSATVVVANTAVDPRAVTIDTSALAGFESAKATAATSTGPGSMRDTGLTSGVEGLTFTANAASVTTVRLVPSADDTNATGVDGDDKAAPAVPSAEPVASSEPGVQTSAAAASSAKARVADDLTAQPVAMSVPQGSTLKRVQMSAPLTVELPASGSDATVLTPVTWDWASVDAADLLTLGTIDVVSDPSHGFVAKLTITVVPATTVNLLGNGIGYHYTVPVGAITGLLFDGNRSNAGFNNQRSGGATNRDNPSRVNVFFDEPQVVTGAGVFALANTNQNRNIGAVTVQYRDITGGWRDVPTEAGWPVANEETALDFEFVASEAVLATALRVFVSYKTTNTWMGLSELEIYGPQAAN